LSRGDFALSSLRGERALAGRPFASSWLAHRVRAEAPAERAWPVCPCADQRLAADRRVWAAPAGFRADRQAADGRTCREHVCDVSRATRADEAAPASLRD